MHLYAVIILIYKQKCFKRKMFVYKVVQLLSWELLNEIIILNIERKL